MDSTDHNLSQAQPPLSQRLLDFYDKEGRTLPWRGERNLYRIWISEVML